MVIILRGCSGSGKSSLLKRRPDLAFPATSYRTRWYCSADHFFETEEGYRWDPTKLAEAHASCLRNYVKLVTSYSNEDAEIVVDNTNTMVQEVAPYAALARAYNHDLRVITLVVPPDVAHRRNVHNVPLETVLAQYDRLARSVGKLPPWWPEEVVSADQG